MSLYSGKISLKLGQIKNSTKKYGLNQEKIDFIESMIRPMDVNTNDIDYE